MITPQTEKEMAMDAITSFLASDWTLWGLVGAVVVAGIVYFATRSTRAAHEKKDGLRIGK